MSTPEAQPGNPQDLALPEKGYPATCDASMKPGVVSRSEVAATYCQGDFQERFSTDSCPAFAWVDLPPAGGRQGP